VPLSKRGRIVALGECMLMAISEEWATVRRIYFGWETMAPSGRLNNFSENMLLYQMDHLD